ncbi:MAG: sensor protein, partial [Verrucomicrobiales bacterium]|nr:sensor protein [Verrucomicrobiales bacterium]
ALIEGTWDLVISDYVLPRFTGMEALRILQEADLSLPFVIISGKIGEDVAVEALKAGASDYLLKDRLTRLGPAIERALEEHAQYRRRQQSEQALRESEERYRRLVESSPEAIFIYSEGKFVFINPAGVKLFGAASPVDLIGKSVLDLIHPDYHAGASEYMRLTLQGVDRPLLQLQVVPLTGDPVMVEAIGRDISYHGDSAAHMICRDITERKRMEEQYQNVQKMEAIGRLAGGVANDFNNLLTVIIGYSGLVRSALGPDNSASKDLEQISTSAERAASLTQQLLALSRKQVIAPIETNLNILISKSHDLLSRILGEGVEIVQRFAPDLGPVRADPDQIQNVILNLAAQARASMPGGGRFSIETRNVHLTEKDLSAGPTLRPGDYILLTISDSGRGFSKEVEDHIFEPFYRSEHGGLQASGLGLASVYGVVRQHGGHVAFTSEVGKGSTFRIFLPQLQTISKALPANRAQFGDGPVDPTVLVVEDEAVLRDFAQLVLLKKGYTVLLAEDGAEALKVAENYGRPIHLLFTDVVMPQIGGVELGREIRRIYPEINVLYTSGYPRDGVLEQGIVDSNFEFLTKPYTAQILLHRVGQLLPSPAAR